MDTFENLYKYGELSNIANNSDYILCNIQMPEEHETMFAPLKGTQMWKDGMFATMSDDVICTVQYANGKYGTKVLHTADGKWSNEGLVKYDVIAWQPMPKPYRPFEVKELVIYSKNGEFHIGKVDRFSVNGDGLFIYTDKNTDSILVPFSKIYHIANEECINSTTLGMNVKEK